jgi:hypothetical protein
VDECIKRCFNQVEAVADALETNSEEADSEELDEDKIFEKQGFDFSLLSSYHFQRRLPIHRPMLSLRSFDAGLVSPPPEV